MIKLTFVIVVLANVVLGHNLPNYIKPCRRSDPDFQKCALQQGKNAIPILAKGDKKLKLRVLDPLQIPEIKIDTSGNLKLILTDVTILGLGQMDLHDINFDTNRKRVSLDLRADTITVLGDYTIDGKILILPITGNGKINVTLDHGVIGYAFEYEIVDRNGKKYINPKEPEVTLKSNRSYFVLENLFGGDPRLGTEMNKFMNENYKEMSKELNPSVTKTIAAIASEIVDNMMARVPYDELVLA